MQYIQFIEIELNDLDEKKNFPYKQFQKNINLGFLKDSLKK